MRPAPAPRAGGAGRAGSTYLTHSWAGPSALQPTTRCVEALPRPRPAARPCRRRAMPALPRPALPRPSRPRAEACSPRTRRLTLPSGSTAAP